MERSGISQPQLAAATGLSQAGISNYLRGVRSLPRAEELYALAQHFGVTMEWLLGAADTSDATGTSAVPSASTAVEPDEVLQVADRIQEQIVRLRQLVGDHDAGNPPRRTRPRKRTG